MNHSDPSAYPERNVTALERLIPDTYQAETAALLAEKEWQSMEPNFAHESNLVPKDLSPDAILAIMGTLERAAAEPEAGQAGVDGQGMLQATDEGEQKKGFVFTNSDGKYLHVLVDNAYTLPPQIQKDPKIYMRSSDFSMNDGKTREYGSYSDARTYASLVMKNSQGQALGVHFQEYGGGPDTRGGTVAKFRKAAAAKRASNYIRDTRFTSPYPDDFKKPEHYLHTASGHVAVIDIGVEKAAD